MKSAPQKSNRGKFKCMHCNDLYTPNHHNRWHQQYCSKPACHHASKRTAQHKWLSSDKGCGYFQGSVNVSRVQEWRNAHPGYWKRGSAKNLVALQDVLPSEPVVKQEVKCILPPNALQDVCFVQPALLIGLIASLTGSALQDEIAETSRRYIASGHDILGIGLEAK